MTRPMRRWHLWLSLGFVVLCLGALPYLWVLRPYEPKSGLVLGPLEERSRYETEIPPLSLGIEVEAKDDGLLRISGRVVNVGSDPVLRLQMTPQLERFDRVIACQHGRSGICWGDGFGAVDEVPGGSTSAFEFLVQTPNHAFEKRAIPIRVSFTVGEEKHDNWTRTGWFSSTSSAEPPDWLTGFWVVLAMLGVPLAAASGIVTVELLRNWNEFHRAERAVADDRRRVVLESFAPFVLEQISKRYMAVVSALEDFLRWLAAARRTGQSDLVLMALLNVQRRRSESSVVFYRSQTSELAHDAVMEMLGEALRELFGRSADAVPGREAPRRDLSWLHAWSQHSLTGVDDLRSLIEKAKQKCAAGSHSEAISEGTVGASKTAASLVHIFKCCDDLVSASQTDAVSRNCWAERFHGLVLVCLLARGVLLTEANRSLVDWYGTGDVHIGKDLLDWAVWRIENLDGAAAGVRLRIRVWGYDRQPRELLHELARWKEGDPEPTMLSLSHRSQWPVWREEYERLFGPPPATGPN